MTFDEIMKEITLGLKNDGKEDIKYLMEQMEKYKNHEFSKEIIRAVGRILYEITPDDLKEELQKILNNNNLGLNKTLEEADFQMYKNDFKKALKIMESLIKNIEELNWYKDDKKSVYYCFNNFFEEIIYKEIFKPNKDVRQIPENYTAAYLKYGVILVELKDYTKAKEILEIANKYNPICTNILFELSEIYKLEKYWEKYLIINKNCLEYAYSSKALARCYRNFGFYYIEQEDYNIAKYLYYLSLDFDQENKMAQSQLLYISHKTGENIQPPKSEEVIELLKANNIQIGPNPLLLSIAHFIAKDAYMNKKMEICKYFSEIIYDLTRDEDFKKIIDQINAANVV